MWKFKDCSKIVNLNSRTAFMAMVTCGKWPLIFQTLSQFLNQHSRKLTRQSKYSYLNFLCCVVIDGHCLYYGVCFQHLGANSPNYNFWKGPVWKNLSKKNIFWAKNNSYPHLLCSFYHFHQSPPENFPELCQKMVA